MIKAQEKVIDFCKRLSETIKPADLSENLTKEISTLGEGAAKRDLIMPVVGGFNAGKSTMINALLSTDILPTAITPETSLATELHFSPQGHLEAIKEDGSIDSYGISKDDMRKLTDNAEKYQYARLYLNNPFLKEIEPLVLVDMPGFDSPLDAHDKAITAYLNRGCHYIVLLAAADGTINDSLRRRLLEINNFKRGFNLFLSKADEIPKEGDNGSDKIASNCQEQIRVFFDKDVKVMTIDNKSKDNVLKALKAVNVNKLFFDLYRQHLNILCANSIEEIKIKISAGSKDEFKMLEAVKELKETIAKIEADIKNKDENDGKSYLSDVVDKVVKDISDELVSSREALAVSFMHSKDPATAVPAILNEIIRSSAVSSIKKHMDVLSEDINKDLLVDARALDKVMKDIEIDYDYSSNISNEIMNKLEQFIDNFFRDYPIGETIKKFLPILRVILSSLVNLISSVVALFKGKETQKKEIEALLISKIILPIKLKIRDEITKIIAPAIETMKANIQTLWIKKLEDHKAQINKAIEEKKSGALNIEKQLQTFKAIISEVSAINDEISLEEK
jgi:GTP-binding protein EngB required for normal cell division